MLTSHCTCGAMTANTFHNNLSNLKLPPQLFFNGLQQVERPDGAGGISASRLLRRVCSHRFTDAPSLFCVTRSHPPFFHLCESTDGISHTLWLSWNVCSAVVLLFLPSASPITMILFPLFHVLCTCHHFPFFSYLPLSIVLTPANSALSPYRVNLLHPNSLAPSTLPVPLFLPPLTVAPSTVKGRMPKRNALLITQLSW